jgi:SAM-dependent methyltransferase
MNRNQASRNPKASTGARRLCLYCGAAEVLAADDTVWTAGHACTSCGQAVPVEDGIPLYAAALADTVSGFDPADFARLAKIEIGHFWFVPRNALLGGLATRYAHGARRILEIGCGTGFVLAELAHRFPDARLVGSELHPSGLLIARERLGMRAAFAQMDARAIPAEAVFDLIGAFDVIEHIEEDEVALAAIHRALAPGGIAIIAVPQHPWLWSEADDVAHHARRYSRGEMNEKLRRAGFDVVFSTSYCALPLPLMMASRAIARFRQRAGKASQRSEVEAAPPRLVNAALRSLLRAEVALGMAGLRFPVGGSRVVVARRPA